MIDDNRVAGSLLAVSLLTLVIFGLGISVVASLLNFQTVHAAIESFGRTSLSAASLDTYTSAATGGILDFATILGILWTASDATWIVWLVRHWD